VLVDDAGRPHLLWGGRSAPLGARFGAGQRTAAEVLMMPGSRLLLYTDGLVERRDQALEDRLARLLDEVTQWQHAPVEQLLDHTVDRMLRGAQVQDDICVLALAYRETAIFERTVMAHRPNLADLRHQLSDWLTEQQVPPEAQPAVVLCCSEAVANSIEHGYADDPHGAVHVIADLRGDRLQLRVEDRGTWRPPRPVGHRGRGLQLMRQLMNDVDVDTGTGTVVTMHHRLVNVEDR
jgi:serine/threonine-protein kinase RsbW